MANRELSIEMQSARNCISNSMDLTKLDEKQAAELIFNMWKATKLAESKGEGYKKKMEVLMEAEKLRQEAEALE